MYSGSVVVQYIESNSVAQYSLAYVCVFDTIAVGLVLHLGCGCSSCCSCCVVLAVLVYHMNQMSSSSGHEISCSEVVVVHTESVGGVQMSRCHISTQPTEGGRDDHTTCTHTHASTAAQPYNPHLSQPADPILTPCSLRMNRSLV